MVLESALCEKTCEPINSSTREKEVLARKYFIDVLTNFLEF